MKTLRWSPFQLFFGLIFLSGSVAGAKSLEISGPASLPDGVWGAPYGPVTFSASGGSGTGYTWSCVYAPPGLWLSPAGVLSGPFIAATPGLIVVDVVVKDSEGTTATARFLLKITEPRWSLPHITNGWQMADAQVGVPYGPYAFAIEGGRPPYQASVFTGFPWDPPLPGLPNGMTLSSGSVLSGTPAPGSEGSNRVRVLVTDSDNISFTSTFDLLIKADSAPLAITGPSELPAGRELAGYGPVSFTTTGGSGTKTWNATGLPVGLALSTAGVLSGIPASGSRGSYSVTASVRDGNNRTAAVTLPLAINGGALVVGPASLPAGTVGVAYGPVGLTASGGIPPYTFTATRGLPNGMTLSAAGALGGTPASGSEGGFNLTVSVRDSAGTAAPVMWPLLIQSVPLTITGPASLPPGKEVQAYSPVAFTAAGGAGGYGWTATGLPTGLSIGSGGVLAGTPITGSKGTYNVRVMVTDSRLGTAQVTLPLIVYDYPVVASPTYPQSLPDGKVGTPYSYTLTANGGMPPYTWQPFSGFPDGLTLSPAGVISGTPPRSGFFYPAVTVTDAQQGVSASALLVLTISSLGPLEILTPSSFPAGRESEPYAGVTLTASGGDGGYYWQASGLPSGLTLTNNATGIGQISGTPALASRGNYSVQIICDDQRGRGVAKTFVLTIQPTKDLYIESPTSFPTYTASATVQPISFVATGGTPPYTWTATGIPPGLSFSSDGVLSGTISASAGQDYGYYIRFTVRDSAGKSLSGALSMAVSRPMIVTGSTALGPYEVGRTYFVAFPSIQYGTPPFTWLGGETLPAGVTIQPNGEPFGTLLRIQPVAAGTYTSPMQVTDWGRSQIPVTLTFTFVDVANPTVVSPSILPDAQEGDLYSPGVVVQCLADGGTGGYSWTASGLPPGLSMSASGILSGLPAAGSAGAYSVVITVADNRGKTGSRTLPLQVRSPKLKIANVSLGGGIAGAAYGPVVFSVSGGRAPYTWSATGLPPGLSFSSDGVLAGPIAYGITGDYEITVRVRDADGAAAAVILPLKVATPIAVTCTPKTGPEKPNVPYSSTCSATGGVTPYTWSISGNLPPGVIFDRQTGSVSGIPFIAVGYQYTITVTDSRVPPSTASQWYSGTMQPPTITVVPSSLSFSSLAGNPIPPQSFSITPAGLRFTVATGAEMGCPWLTVSPTTGESPTSIQVTANAQGLTSGTYTCNLMMMVDGTNPASLRVTLNVAGPPLTVTPPTLEFLSTAGASAPAPMSMNVSTSTGEAIDFTAASGCPWVSVTQSAPRTPATLAVSADPSGMGANSYTCPIVITAPAASGIPQASVVLRLTSAELKTTPLALALSARQGSTTPVTDSLSVTGPASSVNFTAEVSRITGGSWLSLDRSIGSTPALLRVKADPAGIAPGTHAADIVIRSSDRELVVPVTFSIASVNFRVVPPALSFQYQEGTEPAGQTVSVVADDGAPLNVTWGTGGNISATGGPGPGNITVLPVTGLKAGTYGENSLTIAIPGDGGLRKVVPVTVTVDAPPPIPVLTVAQSGLAFQMGVGVPPAAQLLVAVNQGSEWTPTVSATTSSGGRWLSLSRMPETVGAGERLPISVSADVSKVEAGEAGSVEGSYSGEVLIENPATGQSVRVPVTLTVSTRPSILVSRQGLSFTIARGSGTTRSNIVDLLNRSSAALDWNAVTVTQDGGDWLKLDRTAGSVGGGASASLYASVDAAAGSALEPGVYSGSVKIHATDPESGEEAANSPQVVSVQLNVLPAAAALSPDVYPGALVVGRAASEASVTIYNPGSAGIEYSVVAVASEDKAWCGVAPSSGSLTGSVTLAVSAEVGSLSPGVHHCELRFSFSDGSSQTVDAVAIVNGGSCASVGLVVNLREPGDGRVAVASQPTGIEVEVTDSCGNPADGAAVSVSFSNGDNDVTLWPVGQGIYRATWTPKSVSPDVPQMEVMLVASAQRVTGETIASGSSRPLIIKLQPSTGDAAASGQR